MLVLCPNHHADFDDGVIVIDPVTGIMTHLFDFVRDRLRLKDHHSVSKEFFQNHVEELAIEEATARLERSNRLSDVTGKYVDDSVSKYSLNSKRGHIKRSQE